MKRHGIRLTLPPEDPMRAPHLLGDDWEAFRWYATPAERDAAFALLGRENLYYRPGDRQSVVIEKLDR